MLNLRYVDELISVRKDLHGGGVGAPKLKDGDREGAALNHACVVLLSATLQAYVSDIFLSCSNMVFKHSLQGKELENYKSTWSGWDNPNPSNILVLFRRLGADDIFYGLSWQGQSTKALKSNLDRLNQVRNCIAHGRDIMIDKKPLSLRLNQIERWRNVCGTFGEYFESHALDKFR